MKVVNAGGSTSIVVMSGLEKSAQLCGRGARGFLDFVNQDARKLDAQGRSAFGNFQTTVRPKLLDGRGIPKGEMVGAVLGANPKILIHWTPGYMRMVGRRKKSV